MICEKEPDLKIRFLYMINSEEHSSTYEKKAMAYAEHSDKRVFPRSAVHIQPREIMTLSGGFV